MNTLRLCFLELCRLLACRLTWLVIALTLLSPLSGLWFLRPASAGTMLSMYLANPAIVAGRGRQFSLGFSRFTNLTGASEAA